MEKCWQLNSLCGDVPGLGDISPLSWSARLVSMQDTLPKARVWYAINKFVGAVGRPLLRVDLCGWSVCCRQSEFDMFFFAVSHFLISRRQT